MTIALFSDIHANLPALEAFFADLDRREVDAVYCLGDLVGYNTWPNEVIDAIRARRIPTIAGNYDFGVGRASDDCGCAYTSDDERANGSVSIALSNELVTARNRAYLRDLPAHLRLEFRDGATAHDLLLVHGSPRKINEYLFEDRGEAGLLRLMQKANADVLCFGHTHQPYHRVLEDTTGGAARYRHAINVGSVGKPKDRDTRGCYALLTLAEPTAPLTRESVGVEFVRFAYDIERAARAVEESILPNVYADNLRRGY